MVSKSTIAVIPARGGSKRIPRKNIITFDGKPMIAWTIEAAIKSSTFERVFVDTDDTEIAEISLKHGAEVPFLREKNFDDHSSVSAATIEFLRALERNLDLKPEFVFQLMANCPIRGEAEIQYFKESLEKMECDFLLSCFSFGWMNPWWAFKMKNNIPKSLFPEAITKRSQDLEKLYCPTGAIWVAKIERLLAAGTFYGPNHRFLDINWKAALDIDDYEDFELALAVKRMMSDRNLSYQNY